MDLLELLQTGGISIMMVLSLIQISPIKINPWSALARAIGRAINAEIIEILEKNEAKTARYRIIRFDDEIRHGQKHTEEHFCQLLDDIKEYEDYCKTHPKFPNGKAVSAVKKIKQVYEKCRDENSFL